MQKTIYKKKKVQRLKKEKWIVESWGASYLLSEEPLEYNIFPQIMLYNCIDKILYTNYVLEKNNRFKIDMYRYIVVWLR